MSVEENLTAVLRERADQPVDVDALLAGALAGGRARKRRQQRAMALAGAGVAGVTAATVLTVPLGGGGGGLTADRLGMGGEPMPALPAADGEPGLVDRPDLVGADPQVLRFAVPWAPKPTTAVNWSSVDGVERIGVEMVVQSGDENSRTWVTADITARRGTLPANGGDDPATVNETTAVTVDGRPATIEREPASGGVLTWLTWEPVDGVQMRIAPGTVAVFHEAVVEPSASTGTMFDREVSALDDAQLVEFAESIRVDSTTRCTAPIRLTTLPEDARVTGCTSGTYYRRGEGRSYDTTLDLEDAGGSGVGVWVTSPVTPSPGPLGESESPVSYATDLGATPSGTYLPSAPGSDPSVTYQPDPSGSAPPATYSPSGEPFIPTTSLSFTRPGLMGAVWVAGDFDADDAEAVIDGVELAGDLTDPATWPARPAG